ncbi:MerR family transcriptional regulator [Streptomyces sp. NPDC059909]|uniref:helix-turn-helix domain-containing protein n=1 Tax=Streptomyces sp. NPDC059909 TaxID=3346998 RepID=UPI0036517D9B
MNDDGRPGLLTIGQLSRRTGMPVRTIRYWSDIGALPPVGRSSGGFRLYDAGSVARLELVRTLRELGLGLDDVRRVLERETTVGDVADAHVRALDAQIRALQLRRAVLGTVARRRPPAEELTLLDRLARLSADERHRIVEDFLGEVFRDLDADPQLRERMRYAPVDLPDSPTPEQVDAWIELAELVRDPDFRQRMRAMAEHSAAGRTGAGPGREPGAFRWFAKKVAAMVGAARERGITPESAQAAEVLDQVLGPAGTAGPARRADVLARLQAGADAQAERYRQLLAAVHGEPVPPSQADDYAWLAAALRAHPSP